MFSPAETWNTPATSVSGSVRNTSVRSKRKLATIKLESDVDSEESEYEEEISDVELSDVEDDVSVAPTVATEESAEQAAPITAQRSRPRPRPRRKPNQPRLSQWERTNNALIEHHPELACIWDELENAPLIKPVKVPQPEGLSLQLLPFQLEGLDWLLKQEQQERFNGGILADEMGMGKTIQTIALLLAEPRGKPNLVIAPTVALMQWKSEIETHTNNGLSVCLFYGQNRSVTAKEMKEYDVVLTTCTSSSITDIDAVLESVFRKQNTGFKRVNGIHKERSLLHSVEFFRVILDEAHNIKDRACNTARAAFALKTSRKLCLSGTPLQNRVSPSRLELTIDRRIVLPTSISRSRSIFLLFLQKVRVQRTSLEIH
jgi:DNA repair protein RAD16